MRREQSGKADCRTRRPWPAMEHDDIRASETMAAGLDGF